MGQTIHASRFIDLVTRPVSQILKPAYNFGGLSLIQLMEPYVKAWETIRDEIPKIVKAFTLAGLKTDMEKRMENPGEFKRRIDIMTNYRNNRGYWR
nr:anti-CBASS Acb1 family protein [Candidatus Arsenophonus triatominarum]